jgi:hypothetical protein
MSDVDRLDERLSELARATESLGARAGFTDRVMLAVSEAALGNGVELFRSARRLFPAALLVAVLSGLWAVQSERSSNQALVVTDETARELEW